LGLNEPEPILATLAPEPPALEEDAALPDPPPPEPQQLKATGGDELAEATNATPADGTSKCLTSYGYLLRSQTSCTERVFDLQVPHSHQLKKLLVPQATLEICWCPGEDTRT
jgi:hypothetical protein